MKPSRYNQFHEIEDGKTLFFNSATGALAEIEADSRPRIDYLLSHPDQPETDHDRQLLQGLVQGGYLVDDKIDEVAIMRARSRLQRLEGKTVILTIAPTLACNFECDYCYESHTPIRMTEEMEQALLRFGDHHLAGAEKLLVTWFGGEPTLCLPTIERVQKGLNDLAARHGISYSLNSIVSNGYLLDARMAGRLAALGITAVQITIDGPEPIHDRRRVLRNGGGTFRRILDNVADICDTMKVSIRINIDRGNVESAFEVLQELQRRDLLPRLQVHFAQVTSSGGVCADIRDRCFSGDEFSRNQVALYHTLMEKGLYHYDYPQVFASVHCGAMADSAFVVAPNGLLFKCWEELSHNPELSVGSIFASEPTPQQETNLARYRAWDPLKLTTCKKCDILPICMGGCPIMGMREGHPDKGVCSSWKYNLKDMLVIRYRYETQKEMAP